MKIRVEPAAGEKLEFWAYLAREKEFSGYGFVTRNPQMDEIVLYDVVLLDIGSRVYTEIDPGNPEIARIIAELTQSEDAGNLKLWFHRHPMGNGIPGPHNWSGRDEMTCRREPFGLDPALVGWSASIVKTPKGWVGRIDTYGKKGRILHVPVEMSDSALREFNNIEAAGTLVGGGCWPLLDDAAWLKEIDKSIAREVFIDDEECEYVDDDLQLELPFHEQSVKYLGGPLKNKAEEKSRQQQKLEQEDPKGIYQRWKEFIVGKRHC